MKVYDEVLKQSREAAFRALANPASIMRFVKTQDELGGWGRSTLGVLASAMCNYGEITDEMLKDVDQKTRSEATLAFYFDTDTPLQVGDIIQALEKTFEVFSVSSGQFSVLTTVLVGETNSLDIDQPDGSTTLATNKWKGK